MVGHLFEEDPRLIFDGCWEGGVIKTATDIVVHRLEFTAVHWLMESRWRIVPALVEPSGVKLSGLILVLHDPYNPSFQETAK